MPTYHVTGANIHTGERVDRTFTAKNEADARAFLSKEHVAIESLDLVTKATGERPLDLTPAGMQAPRDAGDALLEELRGLRSELRTQTQLLDKTLNHNNSPFFKHHEARTRNAVGCGIIVGVILLAVLGAALGVFLSSAAVASF